VAVRDAMFVIGNAGALGDIDGAHTVIVPSTAVVSRMTDRDRGRELAISAECCWFRVRIH
jgi:hypothetical protein